jgi:hypothetical protein
MILKNRWIKDMVLSSRMVKTILPLFGLENSEPIPRVNIGNLSLDTYKRLKSIGHTGLIQDISTLQMEKMKLMESLTLHFQKLGIPGN